MIIDSSALVAMLLDEPRAAELARTVIDAGGAQMAATSYVEAASVVDRRGDPVVSRRLDDLIDQLRVRVVTFDPDHARLAREAYRDFGRGSGHPAKLNLGDAFSYALARATGEPLLFVGNDFTHTDVEPALPREA